MNKNNFEELIEVVRRLRNECPWDKEQTHDSLRYTMIEECYESVDAINKKDFKHLEEELGDLLLNILLHANIAEENNQFSFESLMINLKDKLIRRHPHIFLGEKVENQNEQIKIWDKIKREEGKISVLDGLPKTLPSLFRAERLQEKAAKVGFDWKNKKDVFEKIKEELNELEKAETNESKSEIFEEYGDLLFSIVNYARHLKINSEDALKSTNEKFIKRFNFIESEFIKLDKDIYKSNLEELDEFWNKAKAIK
ncbi:MAG: nucleoside triphosphate pyrophosphohydrolase [Bacteroidota bacterium]